MRNSLLTCLAVLAATLFSASVGFAQTDQSRIGSEYLPADALATAVLSVSDTMASPAAEMYPTEVADAWCKQNFGIEAQQIKQVKLIVGPPGPLGPQIGLVNLVLPILPNDSTSLIVSAFKPPPDVRFSTLEMGLPLSARSGVLLTSAMNKPPTSLYWLPAHSSNSSDPS